MTHKLRHKDQLFGLSRVRPVNHTIVMWSWLTHADRRSFFWGSYLSFISLLPHFDLCFISFVIDNSVTFRSICQRLEMRQNVLKLNLKSPIFVRFRANLTEFVYQRWHPRLKPFFLQSKLSNNFYVLNLKFFLTLLFIGSMLRIFIIKKINK